MLNQNQNYSQDYNQSDKWDKLIMNKAKFRTEEAALIFPLSRFFLFVSFVLSTLFLIMPISSVQADVELRRNPDLIEGPKECKECHESSYSSWARSHHATTFFDMPKSDEAKEIAKKMGIKRIKSDSDCMRCHFTVQKKVDVKLVSITGTSCESCHGAAKDWMGVHSDYGGKDVKAEEESPEHKKERYRKSVAAGMIRPGDLYAIAQNCYDCHTVPNEKLVNVGGHEAGSNFELVRWSQGEVRHNVWYSIENQESSLERRRMMYIIGAIIELEYALKGISKATVKGEYVKALIFRYKKSMKDLETIASKINAPQIKQAIAAGKSAQVKLNNGPSLMASSKAVSKAAKSFANKYDGSTFAAIDSLLPAAKDYKGKFYQPEEKKKK